MTARLVVSIHDVSPATADQTERWCSDVDSLGVPVSLLVIAGPWRGTSLADSPDYGRVLSRHRDRGDEIVLHGWTHRAGPEGGPVRRAFGRAIARGAAEFAALDADQAVERLLAGRAALAALGIAVDGFTPPGWLASPGTVRALARTGFTYVTTHRGLLGVNGNRSHRGFALSHRPGGGVSERVGALVMEIGARQMAARGGLVRIALHPDDLSRPNLRDTTLRTIEAVVRAGGQAMTYGQLARA